jgi:hypothetical protein
MGRAATTMVRSGWRQWTEGEARVALAELARPGESAAEFARSRGFSIQRIYYWKKRLRATLTVPAFVPVRLPPSTITSATIEIVSSGVTVRVREGDRGAHAEGRRRSCRRP